MSDGALVEARGAAPRAVAEARILLVVLGAVWLATLVFLPLLALPVALAILFTLFFFRDPPRSPPADPDLAVAPADGKIVSVETCDGGLGSGGPVQRIVIFLSIFDVHVNRSPIAGRVEHSEPAGGAFLDARNPKSSLLNARRTWWIVGPAGRVEVRQITGAIARRIVAWSRVGDALERGERFGMIRFGSRTEVDFPEAAEILVRVGERVRGGETPVARLPGAAGQ